MTVFKNMNNICGASLALILNSAIKASGIPTFIYSIYLSIKTSNAINFPMLSILNIDC